MKKPIIIAVANQKGGVGKTTTVMNLGAAFALHKNIDVMVADMDPQSNLTQGYGVECGDSTPSMAQLLDSGGTSVSLENIVVELKSNLFLAPSNIMLSNLELHLQSALARERRLEKALNCDFAKRFDYIIIDCPPSLGLLSVNSLTAAHHVIVPITAEFFSMMGVKLILSTIESMKQNGVNTNLNLLGILLSRFNNRTKLHQQVRDKIIESNIPTFKTVIRDNIRVAEAPSSSVSIFDHASKSTGAEDYQKLATEIRKTLKRYAA
jgi:ATPases involved in chromosome partitioning